MTQSEIKEKLERLLENKDFQDVFIEEFINNRTKQLVLNEDVTKPEVQTELKAIKSFRDFISYFVTLKI